MYRALFLDYTGTMVQEGGRELQELILRVCRHSRLEEPKETVAAWWRLVKGYEERCFGEDYLTEDEIVDRVLADLARQAGLQDDFDALHELMRGFWVHAPLFPEVRGFFEKCPVPIYIITNNGIQYVEKSMEEKGLSPAGIVCGDMARAYKPHRELFEKALAVSGCSAAEALHVGDSYASDVQGARAAGIRALLLQRSACCGHEDAETVRELTEVLKLL